jgi:hypothetical protein
LLTLFYQTRDPALLIEAVELGRSALNAIPADHPDAGPQALALANSLDELSRFNNDADVAAEARASFARAAAHPTSTVTVRITAGGKLAAAESRVGNHEAAYAAIESVVELLPLAATRELRREDRENRLGGFPGVAAHAAATAIAAGRPERAVELLERSRGLLLAEAMGADAAMADLQVHAPDLVAEYERLREHLRRHEEPNYSWPMVTRQRAQEPGSLFERSDLQALFASAERRRRAAAEWHALLARIRARPGLRAFMLPPSVGQLQRAAEQGPIVYITAAEQRCDALALTADPDRPVVHVPLERLTFESARAAVQLFIARRRDANDIRLSLGARRDAQRDLQKTLAWLWDTVTGPILDALGYSGAVHRGEQLPRVWWCPVGILNYLPMHAAGHHEDLADGVRLPRTVLDRVVSSYTATAATLAHVRSRRFDPGNAGVKTLLVGVPDAPGAEPLSGAAAEVEALSGLVAGADVLLGSDAVNASVVGALTTHSIVHFACHGVSDWANPGASRLLLADHNINPLTTASISRLELRDADLAFLSACNTTDSKPRLADEAVHVTSAFQVAGFRRVIGTLWPINDQAAREITTDVYTQLTANGSAPVDVDRSAIALHNAVRRVRTTSHGTATRWAGHIHVGA